MVARGGRSQDLSSAGSVSGPRNCAPLPACAFTPLQGWDFPHAQSPAAPVRVPVLVPGGMGPRLFSLERLTGLVYGLRSEPRRPEDDVAASPGPPHSQTIALFSVHLLGSVTPSSSGANPK